MRNTHSILYHVFIFMNILYICSKSPDLGDRYVENIKKMHYTFYNAHGLHTVAGALVRMYKLTSPFARLSCEIRIM